MRDLQKRGIAAAAVLAGAGAMLVLEASKTISLGQAYCVISVNGTEIGAIARSEDIDQLVIDARRKVMQEADGYAYVDAEVDVEESRERFRELSTAEELLPKLAEAVAGTKMTGMAQVYTVTAGDYSANFASEEDAQDFLEQVKNRTEGGDGFSVTLDALSGQKDSRKAEIVRTENAEAENADGNENAETEADASVSESTEAKEDADGNADLDGDGKESGAAPARSAFSGIALALADLHIYAKNEASENYQNQTGILAIDFADTVYGYENLAQAGDVEDPAVQAAEVTKEKESNTIYVVEAGDCLSTIAEKFETTIDSIVALNRLDGEEAVVYADEELTVAVPKPDISLLVTEGIVYEENFSAEPEVILNDSWYTTREEVRQEGVDGLREINAAVVSENGLEVGRETLHTTVLAEAVPYVVERGTQTPPTYIKPLSGGRLSSGFGTRWGRMHKGVDWSTPVGTTVYASSGGTVSIAGTLSGYGYVVYLNHPDGSQTRYGHLSKILVSPGQSVSQGQAIALSGNTGRSTGPHLHFEILIGGSQVNPLNYIN